MVSLTALCSKAGVKVSVLQIILGKSLISPLKHMLLPFIRHVHLTLAETVLVMAPTGIVLGNYPKVLKYWDT